MGKYTEYARGPFPEKKVRVSDMGPLSPYLRKFLMYRGWYDYPLDKFYEEHNASTLLSCPNFGIKSLAQITFHLEQAGYDVSKFDIRKLDVIPGFGGLSQQQVLAHFNVSYKVPRAEEIIKERENTHGDAAITFGLGAKWVGALTSQCKPLKPHHFAVINILHKLARIVCGKYHEDHWDDIGGYALLGKKLHEKDK